MGPTCWTISLSLTTLFLVTIVVSLLTRPRPGGELVGLVYALTPRPVSQVRTFWEKPAFLGVVTLVLLLILNLIFR